MYQGDKREDVLSTLMSCDIIIYHVTGLHSQIKEAVWAIEGKLNTLGWLLNTGTKF